MDTWGGFNNLLTISNGVYDHQVVVHALNFVNQGHNGVHIQTIKELQMHTKCRQKKAQIPAVGLFPTFPATLA